MDANEQSDVHAVTVEPERPIELAQRMLARAFDRPRQTLETWKEDTHKLALMAAAYGDFKSSMKGMELLGEHLGAVKVPVAENHLHLHGNPTVESIKEASTAELEQRLAQLDAEAEEQIPDDIDPDDLFA